MPRRLKISSPRNSECSVRLSDLDWSNWFTDRLGIVQYFIVRHKTEADQWCRVYCRATDSPRIASRDGVLYWLVD